MTRDWIFVPVIFQVLMTLLIYVRLITVKIRELRAGRVDKARLPLHEDAWPASVLQINNNIRNQFELPVLFYVVSVILWALDAVHGLAMAAASVFVLSRVAHALVHLSTNYVPEPTPILHRRLVGADVHGPAGAVGACAARVGPLKGRSHSLKKSCLPFGRSSRRTAPNCGAAPPR